VIACLVAAALWACAVALFRKPIERLGPAPVNLAKCSLAAVGFWAWVFLAGHDFGESSATGLSLIALSGVVGMSVGDLLLFLAVREGGVQRALVVFNTSPLIAALGGLLVYGELPPLAGWVGIATILLGVTAVETDPTRIGRDAPRGRRGETIALLAALGAATGQALGIVMTRGPIQTMPLISASALRLTAASIALAGVLALTPGGRGQLGRLVPREWARLAFPTVIGTLLAVTFMMKGIREVPTGVSAALLATSPVFALPVARFVLREALGFRSALGTLLVVVGVALLS
jgi:drug/metabolite transporter (DMT)-like permease